MWKDLSTTRFPLEAQMEPVHLQHSFIVVSYLSPCPLSTITLSCIGCRPFRRHNFQGLQNFRLMANRAFTEASQFRIAVNWMGITRRFVWSSAITRLVIGKQMLVCSLNLLHFSLSFRFLRQESGFFYRRGRKRSLSLEMTTLFSCGMHLALRTAFMLRAQKSLHFTQH